MHRIIYPSKEFERHKKTVANGNGRTHATCVERVADDLRAGLEHLAAAALRFPCQAAAHKSRGASEWRWSRRSRGNGEAGPAPGAGAAPARQLALERPYASAFHDRIGRCESVLDQIARQHRRASLTRTTRSTTSLLEPVSTYATIPPFHFILFP